MLWTPPSRRGLADASLAGAWNRLTASEVSSMAEVRYPVWGLITQFRLLSRPSFKKKKKKKERKKRAATTKLEIIPHHN